MVGAFFWYVLFHSVYFALFFFSSYFSLLHKNVAEFPEEGCLKMSLTKLI